MADCWVLSIQMSCIILKERQRFFLAHSSTITEDLSDHLVSEIIEEECPFLDQARMTEISIILLLSPKFGHFAWSALHCPTQKAKTKQPATLAIRNIWVHNASNAFAYCILLLLACLNHAGKQAMHVKNDPCGFLTLLSK